MSEYSEIFIDAYEIVKEYRISMTKLKEFRYGYRTVKGEKIPLDIAKPFPKPVRKYTRRNQFVRSRVQQWFKDELGLDD